MMARRALGIRGMVSYAIITRLRRTAIAVSIASAVVLVASLANLPGPAGLAPRDVAGAIHWNGWIAAAPDGTYTFSVPVGGLVRLAIDGRIVASGESAVPIHLDAAPRAFDFEDRRPGVSQLDVRWSRDGSPPSPIPPSVLFARKPRAFMLTVLSARRLFTAGSQWLWVFTAVGCAAWLALAAWTSLRRSISADVDWPRVRWIVLGSVE